MSSEGSEIGGGEAGASADGGDWSVPRVRRAPVSTAQTVGRRRVARGPAALALTALGVVVGDIGTSPLYALKTAFAIDGGRVKPTEGDVLGIISLVFWSITVIVTVKYIAFVMRADNDGEGGVMALAALAQRFAQGRRRLASLSLLLGVLGASLFLGDSVITPAVSVLSAVEGLEVVSSGLSDVVVPAAVVILVVLFVVQRFGTHVIGRSFGPVMLVWFVVLAVTGLPHIFDNPSIVRALSPTYIVTFVADRPFLAFVALGAVVLAITGAEALYADMGHFGRPPIRRAWFFVVLPCLTLNYLGQGALIIDDPSAIDSPFFLLSPGWSRIPLVALATLATVIASQAVISGAFSIARQAVRLGYLPTLTVRHTSKEESGQIYVPAINWLLFGGVLLLVLAFESSERLTILYGFAVTGTFLIDTTLFLIVAATVWHWARWKLIVLGTLLGLVELAYFAANATKIPSGGWLPLLIAAVASTVMITWQIGRRIVTRRRQDLEGPLQPFIDQLHSQQLHRVPGVAVFPHPSKETAPLALRENVDFNRVLHRLVVLVSVQSVNRPYVPIEACISIDPLQHEQDGIVHVEMRFGFQDEQDIPAMLKIAFASDDGPSIDLDNALYFLSRLTIERGDATGMATWQKRLFIGLSHNAASPAAKFHLPIDRTVVMGARLEL